MKPKALSLTAFILLFCFNCKQDKKAPMDVMEDKEVLDGRTLAQTHCAHCHAFPEPAVMPKRYWKEVLPVMGFHLGKAPQGKTLNDFGNKVAKERLGASGLFPEEALISDKEWKAILDFYEENAPENLPKSESSNLISELKLFDIKALPWKTTGEGLTYLNFENNTYSIGFNTDRGSSYYTKLDSKGNQLESYRMQYPLVDVERNGSSELLLSMGRMFNVDEPTGSISVLAKKPKPFLKNLQRPVDLVVVDLDRDGTMDILVSEFGKYLGGIHIYTNRGGIKKTIIYPKSGAINFVIRDVDDDGLMDFYVLVAQEDESIYLFKNKGDLKFEKHQLISLPPYYGTTHFELLDLDNDGDEDIICSSGDSDDFASALKPYHGIRIFENFGNNNFKEVWFHKQEGAYGTACADYDNDGDMDIASIGYYASLQNKDDEAFLYFENVSKPNGKWQFKVFSPLKSSNNCFMLIEANDIDADGDMDIILGSNTSIFSEQLKATLNKKWQQQGGVVTILRNTTN